MAEIEIRAAGEDDVPLILVLVKELAEYERLSHEVVATEGMIRDWVFGEHRVAEAGASVPCLWTSGGSTA